MTAFHPVLPFRGAGYPRKTDAPLAAMSAAPESGRSRMSALRTDASGKNRPKGDQTVRPGFA
jgi:hypothetical protein